MNWNMGADNGMSTGVMADALFMQNNFDPQKPMTIP